MRGYDYSQAGAYFVTICVQERERAFGVVVDDEKQLNDNGRVVADEFAWQRNYYEHVIRSEDELNHIREYIANNPTQLKHGDDHPG